MVAERDLAVFTLGRLPDGGAPRRRAEDLAARLRELLGDEPMPYGEAGRALGVSPNELRYAAPTGTVLIRWEGAGKPIVRTVAPPEMDPVEARLELARRHLHVFAPSTPEAFARWAGIKDPRAVAAFDALGSSLTPVRTPTGDAWILARDEPGFRAAPRPAAPARLLPSGDAYYLLWDDDRELLVEARRRREALWTPRVWPGAVLVDGEILGTWRRRQHRVSVQPWRRLSRKARAAVEEEAASLPLPGVDRDVVVRWED